MQENAPKISIITPSYNQGHCIEESILSVIHQDYPNLEYIILDGGSTDNTLEVIKKYEDKITYWHSKPDKGTYDAMNKGIRKATGEWLYFLGTDDKLCPNIISEIFVKALNPKEYDFIYGYVKFVPSGRLYGKEYTKSDLVETNICHQAIFTRRKIFEKLGKFKLKYHIFADYVFNMKIFSKKDIRKYYINLCIAEYNELGASYQKYDRNFFINRYRLIKNMLGLDRPKYKVDYQVLGEEGFMLLRDRKYKEGIKNTFLAAKHTRKLLFYIKNTLYWIKESISY